MTPPSTSELLDAWEQGLGLPAWERPVALLTAGAAQAPTAEIARMPLGEREAELLDLREWAFGSSLTGTVCCPRCGCDLELPLEVEDVRVPPASGPETGRDHEIELKVGEYQVFLRLPNSLDVREVARAADVEQARLVLLRRCVVRTHRDGRPVDATALPGHLLERVEQTIAERSAQADVRLAVTCPECAYRWDVEFDAGAFLWREVDQWARRLLVDVATLASAFGWTEDEVLRLGPDRREAYLELVRS